ncbi:M61 family peptidase [Acidipila sp. EB88]|nr:M61 family peptidase [Acidipila sp. EB88]
MAQAPGQSIRLHVDETDAPRKLIHAEMDIPAQPGPLTLLYPKWIPGEHTPTGPIDNLAGLLISADGKSIPWQRDSVNMFAFHLAVPQGVTSLHVKCDFLATSAAAGFSAGASTTANLAMLSWNEVLFYPEGSNAADLEVAASVTLPAGWHYGTALTRAGGSDNQPQFAPVSMEQLIDSPLLAGRYFREILLAPELSPKHFLDLAADGPEELQLRPQAQAAFDKLVRETGALYQSRHYGSYHFLVTLSDEVAHFGLEHHQSSDDRVPSDTFLSGDEALLQADLLPHEFTHSWNGKYRRPAGLATGNYQDPMRGDLLWVYEGLTQYLGDVLAARSGIETAAQYRDALAYSAASLDARPGRTWRDLQDTATAAQILYDTSSQWDNWRRSVDYYPEGELLWLEIDTLIRKQTNDRKSLNDFCARFHGLGGNTPPRVVPYTFDDIVANLNAVTPYDWAAFLAERLTSLSAHAPLGGIEAAGYKLVYSDQTGPYIDALSNVGGGVSAWWSLGFKASADGHIADVLWNSPAFQSGLGPTMQIIAINGRQFSPAVLNAAITDAKSTSTPMELIVVNTGYYKVLHLDYHGGLRYPHLERVPSTPGRLDTILLPLTGDGDKPAHRK